MNEEELSNINADIRLMLNIYKTYEVDWMGDEIKDLSCLTRHHIIKKEEGGENGISNYALLTEFSHHIMNYIEENDYDSYMALNNLFLELNRSVAPPTIEYYEKVRAIVKRVKKNIKNERRGRGRR